MPTNTNIDSGGAIVGTTNYVYHSDGTVTSDLKNCTQKDKNYTYNPCSGMSFTNSDDVCYTVNNKKELYLYQQFYYNRYGYILFYSKANNCGAYICGNNLYWHTKGANHDNVASVSDGLHTFKMHVITDTDTSKNVMQIWLDGKLVYDGNNVSFLNGETITGVEFFSGSYNYNSNIIISETDITDTDVTKLFSASAETLNIDIARIIKDNTIAVTNYYDISRKVSAELVNVYDVTRYVKDNTIAVTNYYDVSRKTNIDELANYDMQNYSICDTELAVTTQRITSNCFTTTEDIVRNIVYHANIKADTQRSKYLATVDNADTRISIPSVITDQSSGLQSVSIGMGQSQLSDSIRIVTINPVDINGAVIGNFLDYKLNMRAETTSQKGILQEITCMTDKDEILYKKIVYTGDADAKIYHGKEIYNEDVKNQSEILSYMKLSKHMQKIANVIGCNLVMCSDDYISTCSLNDSGATYQSIISELCGWTSKLPNMFINAFLRGNTLYIIQRGHEPNEINIDNLKMTIPTIAKKLVRTEWNNTQSTSGGGNGAGTIGAHFPDDEKDDGDGSDVDKQEPRVETSSDTRYADDGGYSVTETQRTYEEIGALHGAVMISHETEKCTAYSAENPASTSVEDGVEVYRGASRDITVTLTETYHNYDSCGWHTVTTVTTVDGVLKETHTSKSLGSTEGVTPFRVHAVIDTKKDSTTINSGDDVNNYNSLVDSDFPVYGDYLKTCKDDIKWLNRKVQETVTLSIYDYTHIFDFQDKIVYKGNTYSIQSNNFEKNATIVNKQDLVLIRFY